MSLSIFIIVRNEEKHLERCLSSIRDSADEIIVVDTGSTDGTKEIAFRYGSQVYEYEWKNDFADARNYALSKCSKDWVLYIDADEELDKKSIPELKRLTAGKDKAAYYVKIISKNESIENEEVTDFIRLFRNTPEAKFSYRVHEQIIHSLNSAGYKILNSRIFVNHYGYNINKEDKKNKALRNINIMLEDHKKERTGVYAYYLGLSYKILEDYETAIIYLREALKSGALSKVQAYDVNSTLAYLYHGKGMENEAAGYIKLALETNPESPYTNYLASKIYLSFNRIEDAQKYCLIALNNNEKDGGDEAAIGRIEPEEIIYYGLSLGFFAKNGQTANYYLSKLDELYKVKFPDNFKERMITLIRLLTNNEIEKITADVLIKTMNRFNLNLIIGLSSRITDLNVMFTFIKEVLSNYNAITTADGNFETIYINTIKGLEEKRLFNKAEELRSLKK